jgi:hypothetical protein
MEVVPGADIITKIYQIKPGPGEKFPTGFGEA